MARKSFVPHWVYYAVALLCTLATVPMYRYMLGHASDRFDPSLPPVRERLFVEPPLSAPVSSSTVLEPLRVNELCEAGYLVIRNGNAYRQAWGPYGQPAHCVPGYAYAHVVRSGDSCTSGVWLQVLPAGAFLTDMRCVLDPRGRLR